MGKSHYVVACFVLLVGAPAARAEHDPFEPELPKIAAPKTYENIDSSKIRSNFRCNSVETVDESEGSSTVSLEVRVSPKLKYGIAPAPVALGMGETTTRTHSSQIDVKFCVPAEEDGATMVLEKDESGVLVTAQPGVLQCGASLRVEYADSKSAYLSFFGSGFKKTKGGKNVFEAGHTFEVEVQKGIPVHKLAQFCKDQPEWGAMSRDLSLADDSAEFIMTRYSGQIQCIYDEECPTPRSEGPLAADLSYALAARCKHLYDGDTKQFLRTQCVELGKVGTNCTPGEYYEFVGGGCDKGLKCAFDRREWFPSSGGLYENRYKCQK